MNPQILFLLNKSIQSLRSSNLESAELYLKQALKLQASNPDVLRLLGVIATQRRQYSQALKYFNSALKAFPKHALALSNLGSVFLEMKEYSKALDAYDQSLKIDPKDEETWSNKGITLNALKRYDEALTHYDHALSLQPKDAKTYCNKSITLHELERYEEAMANYDKALSLRPNDPKAHSNKGVTLHELQRFEEAITHHDKALRVMPTYHEASWNKSLSLLLQGDFKQGLPLYEHRWDAQKVSEMAGKRVFHKPTWLGTEALQGKTILLYGEQGLGDFIQFCRYVQLVAHLGATVILETPASLAGLLEGLEGVSQLVIRGQELPHFDYQCPLLSLPLAFNTTISTIPTNYPYLAAHASTLTKWQLKLGEKRKKRIGLVWSSMSSFKSDSKRSLMLADFVKALPVDGFEYVCLQKELKASDQEFFAAYSHIRFFGDELEDFTDTAALIDNLDLVISTCTSVPHLSGALGKETWLLLSYVPDWRWLLDREDSPWYPSIKLYRQPSIGDWNSVLQRVKSDLSNR